MPDIVFLNCLSYIAKGSWSLTKLLVILFLLLSNLEFWVCDLQSSHEKLHPSCLGCKVVQLSSILVHGDFSPPGAVSVPLIANFVQTHQGICFCLLYNILNRRYEVRATSPQIETSQHSLKLHVLSKYKKPRRSDILSGILKGTCVLKSADVDILLAPGQSSPTYHVL
jgi:hypothetical protein